MLYPQLEEKLDQARNALKEADSENINELCKQYLATLGEYRAKLYELQGTSTAPLKSASSSSCLDIAETRKAIRAAIENTTKERNRTEVLLLSFTTLSGYEAVAILNKRKYKGHGDWEQRSGGIKFNDGTVLDLMTIQQAVDTASLLLREDHIARNAAQAAEEGPSLLTQ